MLNSSCRVFSPLILKGMLCNKSRNYYLSVLYQLACLSLIWIRQGNMLIFFNCLGFNQNTLQPRFKMQEDEAGTAERWMICRDDGSKCLRDRSSLAEMCGFAVAFQDWKDRWDKMGWTQEEHTNDGEKKIGDWVEERYKHSLTWKFESSSLG